MELGDINLRETARAILARRGIDPDTTPEPKPFRLADHLTQTTEATLALVLPPEFRHAEPRHPDVRRWVSRYLNDPATCPGLLLRGPIGSGKTTESLGALRTVALTYAKAGRRLTYLFTSHPEFNRAMRPQNDDGHNRTLADMQAVDLLVFDDLGVGKLTDWGDDTLFRLIDTRWSHHRPTIVTTNLSATKASDLIDERILSRLATSVQVPLTNTDWRRAGKR